MSTDSPAKTNGASTSVPSKSSVADRVLYEDNHLIVVNKLPSEIVQEDETGDETLMDTVRAFLKDKYGKPGNVFIGIPHRLDRPTSGIVVMAKTGKALSRMSELFRKRDVKKVYWAVVDNAPPEPQGRLVNYVIRNRQKNKSFVVNQDGPGQAGSAGNQGRQKGKNPKKGAAGIPGKARKASLTYKLMGATKSYFLLEIELETGRHHQIRAQLSALGIHIKGDLKYGAARSNRGGGIHLHARRVEFIHPVNGKEVVIVAPPPADQVWTQFSKLDNN